MDSVIQVKQSARNDDSITGWEYHTYSSYSSSFHNNDEIRICIQAQDLYILPSESYLLIELAPTRNNGDPLQAGDGVLVKNFVAHLFAEIRYELNGFELDRCKTPGITSLMKNSMACKSSDKDSLELFMLNDGGQVSGRSNMMLPLKFLFGFCEDFNKIIMNSRHELILIRSRNDDNAYIGAQQINFNMIKIHWKVPHISLNDRAKLTMLRTLKQNEYLPIAYRSWDLYELSSITATTRYTWNIKTTSQVTKPRYVIVAFQTARDFQPRADSSKFDHCNVTNIKLKLNNQRYPYDDLQLNFGNLQYHELFNTLKRIQRTYYNGTEFNNPTGINYDIFQEMPLFAFDCSRSDESVKNGMVDISIDVQTSTNFPDNTNAYCLIIHDNLVRYSPFESMVYRDI